MLAHCNGGLWNASQRCMKDLELPRGYLIYPGRTSYSLGEHVTALSAEKILSSPQAIASLE